MKIGTYILVKKEKVGGSVAMEHIVAKQGELMSILLGYNIDAGWRSQSDVIIYVPYTEWAKFNSEHSAIRVNIKSLNHDNYMLDIAMALYNELLFSSRKGKDATLIIPVMKGPDICKSDYIEFCKKLPNAQLNNAYCKIDNGIRNYFRCIDVNMNVSTLLKESKLSEWNKLLYRIALSYLLLKEPINIQWR